MGLIDDNDLWGSVPRRARWVLVCAIAAIIFYLAVNTRSPLEVAADDIRDYYREETK